MRLSEKRGSVEQLMQIVLWIVILSAAGAGVYIALKWLLRT